MADSSEHKILILYLRKSRIKAKEAAVAEVIALTRDLGSTVPSGGPLSQHRGTGWIGIPIEHYETAVSRLDRLGYTVSVDTLEDCYGLSTAGREVVRWKGRSYILRRVYDDDPDAFRAEAPDKRAFLLECEDKVVRRITGYRGGSGFLQRRALPVEDARLLTNLVFVPNNKEAWLLDPFAGAGGIIRAARAKGFNTTSLDKDPALRFGLSEFATKHYVGDATRMPFKDASFDAVASEPPYHASALESLVRAMGEIGRIVRPGGRVALLLASEQVEAVIEAVGNTMTVELRTEIDRKGTSVSSLCWIRSF